MTRPPISKLRKDVLRAAMREFKYNNLRMLGWNPDESETLRKQRIKACAALAEREKKNKAMLAAQAGK